jgi:hypothetical protein
MGMWRARRIEAGGLTVMAFAPEPVAREDPNALTL